MWEVCKPRYGATTFCSSTTSSSGVKLPARKRAGGEAERAVAHALAHDLAHAFDFVGGRRPIDKPDHRLAHRALPDEAANIGRLRQRGQFVQKGL